MPKYLIDVNLPAKLSIWHNENFVFVMDIDPFLPDTRIWQLAKDNDFVIVTKDRDFYDRVLLSSPPPKVIYFRFGNLKMAQFYTFVNQIWGEATALIEAHKVVVVFSDRLEAIK